MAPPEPEIHENPASFSNAHSLKAAIVHTMAFRMSLEINNYELTIPTKTAILKDLYNVCRIRKNNSNPL